MSLLLISGILSISFISFICSYYPFYKRGLQKVANHPGFRSLISPMSFAGFGTPYIRGVYPGFDMPWQGKHKLFAKWKSDVISCVSWSGCSILYLADADLIQKINGNQHTFPKPVEEYTVLNFFGPNLVTASGRDWRRQQAVSKDVFTTKGWHFLWQETHNIFQGMMTTNSWDTAAPGTEVKIDHAVEITLRVALLAIANAGFGMKMGWKDDMNTILPPGHTLSFQSALHTVAQSSILKLALPRWAYYLPIKRIQHMRTAFSELQVYIAAMIQEKKADFFRNKEAHNDTDDVADLFTNLVKASMEGVEPLTDEELMGNIYIYLLAGHETTAHSIAFNLALLALWPEKQEALYQHILQVMPSDGVTTYEHYAKFNYVRAVYFETLRMFPPVQQIPKKLSRDTVLVFDKTNEHNVEIGLQEQARSAAAHYATPPLTPARDTFPPASDPMSTSISEATLSASSSTTSISTAATSTVDDSEEPHKELPGGFPLLHASLNSEAPTPLTRPSMRRNKSECKPIDLATKYPTAATEEQISLTVEKDTIVFVCPPAVHYNPKYYPEPYEFKPERFVDKFDSTTFIPFSSGTRVCVGRHFSEVESVCFLAYLMRDFSVHPVPAFEGETRDQMKERMFKAIPLITLTPLNIPIILKRRAAPPTVSSA